MACPKCGSANVNTEIIVIIHLVIPNKSKIQQKYVSTCICQNCGHHWEIA